MEEMKQTRRLPTGKTTKTFNILRRKRARVILLLILAPLFLPLEIFTEDFLPGNGHINERDILRRMEKELGEKLNPREKPSRVLLRSAKTVDASESGEHSVRLTLRDGTVIRGKLRLNQSRVVLRPLNGKREQMYRIPLSVVEKLRFLKWKKELSIRMESGKVRDYFFPSECVVHKTDGTKINGRCRIQDWMQLNIQGDDFKGAFRAYYTNAVNASSLDGAAPSGKTRAVAGKNNVASELIFNRESVANSPGKLKHASSSR